MIGMKESQQKLCKKDDIIKKAKRIWAGFKEIRKQKLKVDKTNSRLTKNETNDKEDSTKGFMKKLLRESEEFTYYTPYVRKISFSERKKINLNNIIPQIYLNTDKKSKITIRNSTKEKLEDLKPIFGNLDSAINSLFDFFIYIEYCMVKGNDAK